MAQHGKAAAVGAPGSASAPAVPCPALTSHMLTPDAGGGMRGAGSHCSPRYCNPLQIARQGSAG
eukprot:2480326-Rhodomonas_salina.1